MNKHNLSNSRLYGIWNGIIQRCENPKRKPFPKYGGRGIKVCDEWRNDFKSFYDWSMSNGYSDDLTIERINNDGNYEPSNCRWATYKEQANNKRCNLVYEINGVRHNLKEWAEIYNISYPTVWARIKRDNWNIIHALTVPVTTKGGTKHGKYAIHR